MERRAVITRRLQRQSRAVWTAPPPRFGLQARSLVQTGDPTGTGRGGESVYKMMHGDQAHYFEDEIHR